MALTVSNEDVGGRRWTADRRLWLTAAGDVVEDGDPDARMLLCVAGGTLPWSQAAELGLVDRPTRRKAAKGRKRPPADKAVPGPDEDKAGG